MTPRISRLTSLVLTALVVGVTCAEAQTVAGRPSNPPTATGTKWVVDPVHSQSTFACAAWSVACKERLWTGTASS